METLEQLWKDHNYWLIPLAWMILSSIINVAFRKKTPEQWVEYTKKNPRGAALVRLCRSLGIDPVKALVSFKHFVNGKAQQTAIPKLEPAEAVVEKVVEAAADKVEEEIEEEEKADEEKSKDEKETEK